ncbi:unnamed protein product [Mytilus coruscus]|uniref:PiggyBac transposable element-derived protein domain-containing protein n=1 Tax=Mytilus coruscus TaxID=42192 RepID=A0A6J8BYK4_MYTCO|nr:unnamed protein product [Mytilus coruscus]
MSSDESDVEFEGFSETDVTNVEQEGIGDNIEEDYNESDNENEGEREVNVDERGDGAVEIKAFLTYQMGISRKPSTKLYWSTDLIMVIFSSTMTRDRYTSTQILRYLHFSDHVNEPRQGEQNFNPLYKIKPFVNQLNNKFGLEYVPKRNVTIDECMVPFKGRSLLKQYIPSKPHKWGVKVWMLAESDNSYIQYIDVYPGRTVRTEGSLGSSVVKNCIEGANIAGQGNDVYTDIFFTSPNLYLELLENYETAACGTVRTSRAGLPKDIMCKKPKKS